MKKNILISILGVVSIGLVAIILSGILNPKNTLIPCVRPLDCSKDTNDLLPPILNPVDGLIASATLKQAQCAWKHYAANHTAQLQELFDSGNHFTCSAKQFKRFCEDHAIKFGGIEARLGLFKNKDITKGLEMCLMLSPSQKRGANNKPVEQFCVLTYSSFVGELIVKDTTCGKDKLDIILFKKDGSVEYSQPVNLDFVANTDREAPVNFTTPPPNPNRNVIKVTEAKHQLNAFGQYTGKWLNCSNTPLYFNLPNMHLESLLTDAPDDKQAKLFIGLDKLDKHSKYGYVGNIPTIITISVQPDGNKESLTTSPADFVQNFGDPCPPACLDDIITLP